jgi:hypothetical protein
VDASPVPESPPNPQRCHDDAVDQYYRYVEDRQTLAAIGRTMRLLPDGAPALLPRDLALAAIAAWHRDELEPLASPESRRQRTLREDAATLALIGMTLRDKKTDLSRDPVSVELAPKLVVRALAAAKIEN